MRCLVIGRSPVLIQCLDLLATSCIEIVLIATDDEKAFEWAENHETRTCAIDANLCQELDDSIDYLFSIINPRILDESTLALATRAAINYHDGKLSKYRGSNVLSWAIYQGDLEAYCCWHLMIEDIDVGQVLVESKFDLDIYSTVLSASFEASRLAVSMFADMLPILEIGDIPHGQFPETVGCLYKSYDRFANGGIIHARIGLEEAHRIIRALDWGSFSNPMGYPALLTPNAAIFVRHAILNKATMSRKQITVESIDERGIMISDGHWTLCLNSFLGVDGNLLSPSVAAQRLALKTGEPFPHCSEELITKLGTLQQLRREEGWWRSQLLNTHPAPLLIKPLQESLARFHKAKLGYPTTDMNSKHRIIAAFLKIIATCCNTESFAFALSSNDTHKQSTSSLNLLSSAVPVNFTEDIVDLSKAINLARSHGSFFVDLELRIDAKRSFTSVMVMERDVGEEITFPENTQIALLFLSDNTIEIVSREAYISPDGLQEFTEDLTYYLSQDKLLHLSPIQKRSQNKLLTECNEENPLSGFEYWAEKTPNASAIYFEGTTITYKKLNEWSNIIVGDLLERHVSYNDIVGLLVKRGPTYIASLLACLKAGFVALPMDSHYPIQRLKHYCAIAKPSVIITDNSTVALAEQLHTMDPSWPSLTSQQFEASSADTTKKQVAYILFTSGSTGHPKGVRVGAKALANHLKAMCDLLKVDTCDTVLAHTTVSFDISILEFLLPLNAGATMVLASDTQVESPHLLADLINTCSIAQATPSMWKILRNIGWIPHQGLKILCGGEVLTPELAKYLQHGSAELWNVYGPTEATIWASAHLVDKIGKFLPLGQPLRGVDWHIFDENRQSTTYGELLISGISLADGYIGIGPSTSSPFTQMESIGRVYRTGDLVKLHEDGNIEWLGRLDGQIKIRGHRFEKGEIQIALESLPYIKDARVLARSYAGNEHLQLCAYLIPDGPITREELDQYLAKKFPRYMIPDFYILLDEFPLTLNRKVDVNSLPDPSATNTLKRQDLSQLEQVVKINKNSGQMNVSSITEVLSEILKHPLSPTDNFFDHGGDSITATIAASLMSERFGQRISPALLFATGTGIKLAEILNLDFSVDTFPSDLLPDENKSFNFTHLDEKLSSTQDFPGSALTNSESKIAIVAMSCRFPSANSIDEYWELLVNGRNAVSQLERDLRPTSHFWQEEDNTWAGWLDDVISFDYDRFNISRREACRIDPAQRLLLTLTDQAMESAGYHTKTFPSNTGVFIGAIDTWFSQLVNAVTGSKDPHFATGVGDALRANRISHTFGFTGPSFTLDTACSSALIAIDEAIRHLKQGEISAAIVGAANVLLTPEMTRAFTASGMLSPHGRCRTFDASADGYVRAEGGAILILRRLSDALAEKDPILGIISGSSTNHSGGAGFITAPSSIAQEDVIRRAMQDADVSVKDIGYVEAHGTGTRLGDLTELETLERIFLPCVKQSVGIGSVKSNIGHLEPAAGLASVIKVVLSLQARIIPPSIGIKRPNEAFPFEASALFVPTQAQPWLGPLRAGVSCFGFGGTNAHAIIEAGIRTNFEDNTIKTIELKAHSKSALKKLAADTLSYIRSPFRPTISELVATLAGIPNRTHHFRCHVENYEQLEDKLVLFEYDQLGTGCEFLDEFHEPSIHSYIVPSGAQRTRIPTETHRKSSAWIELPSIPDCVDPQDNIISLPDLSGHKIREQPVLPAVAIIRLLSGISSERYPIVAQDVIFANAINPETQLEQQLIASCVRLVDLQDGKTYWSAQLGLEKAHGNVDYKKYPPKNERIALNPEDIYTKFQHHGLNYSGPFRSIVSVEIQDRYASGVITKVQHESDNISQLDGQLDGALQIGLIACGAQELYVPTFIESITIHGQLNFEHMLVEAFDTTDELGISQFRSTNDFLRASIVIKTNDTILIELRNVLWKKIPNLNDQRQPLSNSALNAKLDSAPIIKPIESDSSVLDCVRQVIARVMEVNVNDIKIDKPLTEQGMDSIVAISVARDLEEMFEQPLPITIALDSGSVRELAQQLSDRYDVSVQSQLKISDQQIADEKQISHPSVSTLVDTWQSPASISKSIIEGKDDQISGDIAVVGIAGRFPSEEDSLEGLWKLLQTRKKAIREVPASRWPLHNYYSSTEGEGTTYLANGGFLNNIDTFDTTLFNLSPAEARWIDPQQRLLLQVVWEALEDAGLTAMHENVQTGVFVGASYTHHRDLIVDDVVTTAGGLGNHNALLANRVSYFFDFTGPSMTIDTLCSSSLVALHQAVQSLRNHECDQAIVAGVHVDMSPLYFQMGSRLRAFSRSGELSAFDSSADGFIPGEGVVVLILQRSDEINDHRVKAVIKGTAVNHGGRSAGLTVPSSDAQATVVSAALRDAGVSVDTIGLVEAHGTGTVLGDPIEIEGLKKAWSNSNGHRQVCGLGSIKSNIGHLEPAAGLAGVAKVILAMQENILPPTVGVSRPNDHIAFENSPFFLIDRPTPWPANRPLAGVSAFGMGGVNAHVILAPASAEPPVQRLESPSETFICKVSAATESALRRLAGLYAEALDGLSAWQAADFCFTANTARATLSYIVVVSASTVNELIKTLKTIANGMHAILTTKDATTPLPADMTIEDIVELARDGIKLPHSAWHQLSPTNTHITSIPTYPFDAVLLQRPDPPKRATKKHSTDTSSDSPIHPFLSLR